MRKATKEWIEMIGWIKLNELAHIFTKHASSITYIVNYYPTHPRKE